MVLPGENEHVHRASIEIGETSNNVAELQAIHYELQWILNNRASVIRPSRSIRVFTDSQYSRNALLNPIPTSNHFYLVESIVSLGARLRFDCRTAVTLHWIPSHIEQTTWGWRPIHGNREADKLAETTRDRSKPEHSERQVARIRAKVSELVTHFLQVVEKAFQTPQDPKNLDGPSSDDFDSDASQENSSASCDV